VCFALLSLMTVSAFASDATASITFNGSPARAGQPVTATVSVSPRLVPDAALPTTSITAMLQVDGAGRPVPKSDGATWAVHRADVPLTSERTASIAIDTGGFSAGTYVVKILVIGRDSSPYFVEGEFTVSE
jgi:hypothetical protein